MKKKELIGFYGKQVNIAQAFDISPESVCMWGDFVPPERALQFIAAQKIGCEPWQVFGRKKKKRGK